MSQLTFFYIGALEIPVPSEFVDIIALEDIDNKICSCLHCGAQIKDSDVNEWKYAKEFDGDDIGYVCNNCADKHYWECEECDDMFDTNLHEYDNKCKNCFLGSARNECIENDSEYIDLARLIMSYNYLNSNVYKHGKDGYFLRLTDDIGVKFYTSRVQCQNIYKAQYEASLYKLAPMVGSYFEALACHTKVYAYITEAIEKTIYDDKISDLADSHMCDEGFDLPDEMEYVNKKLELLGYSSHDNHIANVGYDKYNNLVCIDFSRS